MTDAEREPVFVVNESLARGAFPGEDPIGKRIQTGGTGCGREFGTIVGVVADLKYTKLDESPEPEIFADYAHASPFTINFVVRTTGNPLAIAPTIRALVAGVDKRKRSPTRGRSRPRSLNRSHRAGSRSFCWESSRRRRCCSRSSASME